MSIASEISRLQTAKSTIKTAIEDKGVTVPSSATLSTYDAYIEQIQGGGGNLPKNVSSWEYDDNGIVMKLTNTASTLPTSGYSNFSGEELRFTNLALIPNYFLSNSQKLTKVTFDQNITSVGESGFRNCIKLTEIDLGNESKSVGQNAFYGCSGMTHINGIGDITSAGIYTFYGCNNLQNGITISSSSSLNLQYAFHSCYAMPYVEMLCDVSSILYCFYNAASLSYIRLGGTNYPTTITSTFYGTSECPIIVPQGTASKYKSSWTSVSERIVEEGWSPNFGGFKLERRYSGNNTTYIETDTDTTATAITSADTTVRTRTQLRRVYIGNNIQEISNYAFNNCTQLGYVGFDKNNTSLKRIGSNAFTSINANYKGVFVIPRGVESIGNNAFSQGRIYVCKPTTPPTLEGNAAFGNSFPMSIYVPDDSIQAYKAATNWTRYAAYIHPMSELPFDLDKYEFTASDDSGNNEGGG